MRMTTVVPMKWAAILNISPPSDRPDAGIKTDMNDQKKDQENTRKAHDEFFAYGGSKEFRPFHS